MLAYFWSHLNSTRSTPAAMPPIAAKALARIKLLYEIEADIRGLPPELRRSLRHEKSKGAKAWFEACLVKVSKGDKTGEAIRYGLNHWNGLVRFLDDGRIEIDSNTIERSIRGIRAGQWVSSQNSLGDAFSRRPDDRAAA
jgi:transposase